MKKASVILFILFISSNSFSQNADLFYNVSKDSAKLIADDLAAIAKSKYQFVSFTENPKRGGAIFYYKDADNDDNRLSVYFRIYNETLEISGTPRYYFYKVEAKFLDVFPFWKKYIQPDADDVKMSKNESFNKVYLKSSGKHQPQIIFEKAYSGDFEILLQ